MCFCFSFWGGTESERLSSGELQDFIRQVIESGTLQEVGSEVTAAPSQPPKELLRLVMALNTNSIEKFLSELSEGTYDSPCPKTKVRAHICVFVCAFHGAHGCRSVPL